MFYSFYYCIYFGTKQQWAIDSLFIDFDSPFIYSFGIDNEQNDRKQEKDGDELGFSGIQSRKKIKKIKVFLYNVTDKVNFAGGQYFPVFQQIDRCGNQWGRVDIITPQKRITAGRFPQHYY